MKIDKEYRIYLFLGCLFLASFIFTTIMNNAVKEEPSNASPSRVEASKTQEQIKIEKCQQVRTEGERLDKVATNYVNQARNLQRTWIIGEMTTLKNTGKISDSEWKVFSDYVDNSTGVPKLPLGEIITLMNKVVRLGYIQPYLPKNVVELGTKAALGQSSSDYYAQYPECFTDLENSVYQTFADTPKTKGAWGRRLESPIELIP